MIEAVLPTRPSDDIALLVARTRRLDPARIAEWDVPPDPAQVSRVRNACARRLADWGLEEIAFTTELILSELITNAIRYGSEPIRVRLLYDRSLICEVSDGSSTSPHLRRAEETDEGGRGLFLVAQFAQRWGTRYTDRGKIIWSEQALHEAVAGVRRPRRSRGRRSWPAGTTSRSDTRRAVGTAADTTGWNCAAGGIERTLVSTGTRPPAMEP